LSILVAGEGLGFAYRREWVCPDTKHAHLSALKEQIVVIGLRRFEPRVAERYGVRKPSSGVHPAPVRSGRDLRVQMESIQRPSQQWFTFEKMRGSGCCKELAI